MNVRELVRPEILALSGYSVDSVKGESNALVRLDNNESPWSPPDVGGDLNRYPPQPPMELRRRMASYYGVDDDCVLPTRGSDDAIDALIRCFCRPARDSIVTTPPTFSMYAIFTIMHGARVLEVPLQDDFSLDRKSMLSVRDGVKLVFLCSPNNPTGRAIPNEVIADICAAWRGSAIVIVDEAYAEFMHQPSASTLLPQNLNLVVLRTLSKGLALAGARVGAVLASPEIITYVRKVLPPYLLPTACVTAGTSVLSDGALEIAVRRVGTLVAERNMLQASLESNAAIKRVLPSDANFLFVECVDAIVMSEHLSLRGFRVRSFSEPRIRNYLRIGIGSPAENRALRAALESSNAA